MLGCCGDTLAGLEPYGQALGLRDTVGMGAPPTLMLQALCVAPKR